jgi:glycine dehydrogenase subunit 1
VFAARTDQPAKVVVVDLACEGYGVHAVGQHLIQVATSEVTAEAEDGFVAAPREVAK